MTESPGHVTWSQQQTSNSLPRFIEGKIFISNPHRSVKDKELYDIFNVYGQIRSYQVAIDNGWHRGFGFVQFLTQESADHAIQEVNGMMMKHKKVRVARYVPRKERNRDQILNQCNTNIYVDGLCQDFSRQELVDTCQTFGKIVSAVVMSGDSGNCQGFGFIRFKTHDAAAQAIKALNGCSINDRPIHCSWAQTKEEALKKEDKKRIFAQPKEKRVARIEPDHSHEP